MIHNVRKGAGVVVPSRDAVARVVGGVRERQRAPVGEPLGEGLRLGEVGEQEGRVAAAVAVVEGQDGQHASRLRQLSSSMVDHPVTPHIVLELVVDHSLCEWHGAPFERRLRRRGKHVLQAVHHVLAVPRVDAVARVPRVGSCDHRANDRVHRLRLEVAAVRRRDRRQAELHHAFRRELRVPEAAQAEQVGVEAARRGGLHGACDPCHRGGGRLPGEASVPHGIP
eukprot:6830601-Prymnesium_polylepis.2